MVVVVASRKKKQKMKHAPCTALSSSSKLAKCTKKIAMETDVDWL